MKKIVLILMAFFAVGVLATAQPRGKDRDKIKALRIAYITEKLDLKSKQAEQFWPIFNAFEDERHELRKSFYSKYKDENPDKDKKAARDYIEANLDYQEKDLDLKKRYKDKLLKVISPEQLAALYQAERGFREMLVKELRNRCDNPDDKKRK